MRRPPDQKSTRRLSLSRRLIAVVLTAVGTGMVVSAAVSVWQQSLQFIDGRREVLHATAQAFSAAVAAAAANRDAAGAYAAIRGIGNVPNIFYAEVRIAEGARLATLGSLCGVPLARTLGKFLSMANSVLVLTFLGAERAK